MIEALPTSRESFHAEIRDAVARFLSSYRIKDTWLLVSGFIEYDPILVRVEITRNKLNARIVHDIDVIGYGSDVASAMIKHRAYESLNISVDHALYTIYEAKRFSEVLSGIGSETRMKLHLPMDNPGPRQYRKRDLTDEDLARLEAYRKRLFLQPIDGCNPVLLD